VEERKTGRVQQFSTRLKELLQQALALSARRNELHAADYSEQADQPKRELTLHLRDRVLSNEDDQRLLEAFPPIHQRFRFSIPPILFLIPEYFV
jgi:hypothetical protein